MVNGVWFIIREHMLDWSYNKSGMYASMGQSEYIESFTEKYLQKDDEVLLPIVSLAMLIWKL